MSQLSTDLSKLSARRDALRVLGLSAGGLAVASCGMGGPAGSSHPNVTTTTAEGLKLVAFPGETEGPYPADGRGRGNVANILGDEALRRKDIRSSFGGMEGIAPGVPMELELQLLDVDNGGAPMAGAAIYIWQCDAAGDYSLYTKEDQNYLRGLQIADAEGKVSFTTVYPGCYPGRFPHIHFEIFTSASDATQGANAILTSQLALPNSTNDKVYEQTPLYEGSAGNLADIPLDDDMVFGDNTTEQVEAQMLKLAGNLDGYRASGIIGYTATY